MSTANVEAGAAPLAARLLPRRARGRRSSRNFQYRVATYMWMIGMLAEPIVYLVVWTTIAEQQGGHVQGITTGEFAAYYIVWTLVRNMNIVFTPYGWEWRIREGELSASLLRPLHPIHDDLAGFAGWKVVMIILWLPIAAVLWLAFDPVARPDAPRSPSSASRSGAPT